MLHINVYVCMCRLECRQGELWSRKQTVEYSLVPTLGVVSTVSFHSVSVFFRKICTTLRDFVETTMATLMMI